MNIFATEQGILGDTDYARQHNTFQAFLTLARSIRKQLGARAYKLDEYIRQLLIACSIPLEEEFFDREDSATNALAASCRMVAKGGGQKSAQANGCYSIVRAYAQAHPLQNQVDNTRSLIYFCELLDDHLAAAMETMIQDIWSDTAGRMDIALMGTKHPVLAWGGKEHCATILADHCFARTRRLLHFTIAQRFFLR